MIESMVEAISSVTELIPGADALIERHRADLDEFGPAPDFNSGVAPYSFFSDLRRYVFDDAESESPLFKAKLSGLYDFLEEAVSSSDDQVRMGAIIRIVHKLYRYESTLMLVTVKPGPKLQRLLEEEGVSVE